MVSYDRVGRVVATDEVRWGCKATRSGNFDASSYRVSIVQPAFSIHSMVGNILSEGIGPLTLFKLPTT